MKFKKTLIFSFFLIIFISACSEKKESAITQKDSNEEIALKTVDFKEIDVNVSENKVEIAGANNKLVLLNFFTTWCPPCKAEIPHLNSLKKKYPNDLEVVGVLLEEHKTNQEIMDFIEKHKITYPITNSKENFELEKEVGGIKTIPTMFLLDKDGKVLQKYIGLVLEEMLEIDIKTAMGQ